uniref:helix-turn-helix domain-containing protein n=1 Tax=Streptomyces atratus TaxID=1893 RepID=UPI002F914736
MTTASPFSAAQAARTALARRLTGLRKDAGLKSFEVADRCGGHKSKASRIENCRTLPSDADIRAWCVPRLRPRRTHRGPDRPIPHSQRDVPGMETPAPKRHQSGPGISHRRRSPVRRS